MAKQPKGELAVVEGFDYSVVGDAAGRVRSSAERIRRMLLKSLENLVGAGNELLAVKEALPHGQFGRWLRCEFGWTERTAQYLMAVAQAFGPKTEMISDLNIQPTAAYLLAAPSAPGQALQQAIERAEAGEEITPAVAKEILAEARKQRRRQMRRVPADKLAVRLRKALGRWRDRWGQKELFKLARHLREFADELEGSKPESKKKGKSD
jgi:hypothetical protein